MVDLQAKHQVIEFGGRVSGPTRFLAAEYGCSVEVIEIHENLAKLGPDFKKRTGLDHLIKVIQGDFS